jgi:aspartate beta-hydroxylase
VESVEFLVDTACQGVDESSTRALGALRAVCTGPNADQSRAVLRSAATRHRGAGHVWLLSALIELDAGRMLAALQAWHRCVSALPQGVSPAMLHALGIGGAEEWQRCVRAFHSARAAYLRSACALPREAHGPRALFRIERALAGYLGEASVFSSHATQRPNVIYVPGLSSAGFFDPAMHPLVPVLMSRFDAIRADFDEALRGGASFQPFLGNAPRDHLAGYVSGGERASWDALFFFRHGRRFDDNHLRFPNTSEVLDELDLCRIESQAPEICFSLLQPHTRIEPHHGVTNARLVVHIPLRVPEGCWLELTGVGRHFWSEGRPLVFDDSFEHSAENPTDRQRGILLMDSWHPDLSIAERDAFRALIEAVTCIESGEDPSAADPVR